jgi:aminoglycoside phosphotransferase
VSTLGDVGLVLHPFPIDPDLPTLPQSMDPDAVRRLLSARDEAAGPEVDVVHHPREGPCVLRYRFGGEADRPACTYYGKVFADGTGATVYRYLRALTTDGAVARVPAPVAYSSTHRLLCTEALPGQQLGRVLKAAYDGGIPGRERVRALRDASAAAGRALSELHRTDPLDAPVHSAADELRDLWQELETVAAVWPAEAAFIRHPVEALARRAGGPSSLVLSHGDFTPSQVLLNGQHPGIVDLDTLCRADPALDVGRFLAHIRLQVARLTGDPRARLAEDLARSFLIGYAEEAGSMVTGDDGGRVALYVGTTLARSAAHACRRLKDDRLEIALGLLSDVQRSGEVE